VDTFVKLNFYQKSGEKDCFSKNNLLIELDLLTLGRTLFD